MLITNVYYTLKPLIPRRVQLALRRQIVLRKRLACSHVWPIDPRSSLPPANWRGWPHQKRFALVLTHDVEWAPGQEKCKALAQLEQRMGFRSSFNFVPERYNVSTAIRHDLTRRGFEIGVHGLKHDGKLYKTRAIFQSRAIRINRYLKEWEAVGFRSPAMHHNLEWLHDLNVLYDASTFDTDPFEPQSDGLGTIFPLWVNGKPNQRGYVELPYTLPQDFTLFVLMKEQSINIWKKKLDWIAAHGGMALLNTHPDYMSFNGRKPGLEEYPVEHYAQLLDYVNSKYADQYWHALPKQMARFWSDRARHQVHHKQSLLVEQR
jgi:hypothetical protein